MTARKTLVAGIDGCRAGWLAVIHPIDTPADAQLRLYKDFAAVLDALTEAAAIAVDIPIGLPRGGLAGGRPADREARAVLGERQSSVFAVPARAAVMAADYREACAISLAHSSPPRKVSKQAFNLFPKIREVDALMTPELQARVVECHPEVAFWAMNGKVPLVAPKKMKSRPFPDGLALRRGLLSAQGFRTDFLERIEFPRSHAGADDLLDACATCWTANRLARNRASRFPVNPPCDDRGLRMEICY